MFAPAAAQYRPYDHTRVAGSRHLGVVAREPTGAYAAGDDASADALAAQLFRLHRELVALAEDVPERAPAAEVDALFAAFRRVQGAVATVRTKLVRCAQVSRAAEAGGHSGAPSYLKEQLGLSGKDAAKQDKLARDLERLPGTAAALAAGELGPDQAAAIGHAARRGALGSAEQTEEQLRFLSFHDPLTGLYNRAYFEEEMKRLTAARHLPMGIIVCDINLLKFINDTFGHQQGDALIRAAADILQRSFRSSDLIARIGGDEFAVLLPESNREVVEERVSRIVEEIGKYNGDASTQSLSLAIGYAVSEHSPLDMQKLFKQADDNMYREKFREEQTGRNRIIQYLFRILGKKDFIAEGHVERLEDYAVKMAKETGLSGERIDRLRLLARFHDLGKVAIRDDILFKPDALSREEYREVKQHCEIGRRIALSSAELAPVAELILKHHEWWNGQGYPMGLKGREIPIECRIIAIADAYDTMTKKYYKEAKTPEDAARELQGGAGTQFDPDLVEAFLRNIDPG